MLLSSRGAGNIKKDFSEHVTLLIPSLGHCISLVPTCSHAVKGREQEAEEGEL